MSAEAEKPKQTHPGVMELEALLADPLFEAGYVATQTLIDPSLRVAKVMGDSDDEVIRRSQALQEEKRSELARLREELTLTRDDAELLEALEVWGQSPNASGGRGSNGDGYNAGVVHYFEYRGASRSKARRYINVTAPSIDDFITYSFHLQSLLEQPDPMQNPSVQVSAQIEDEQGERKLLLLTQGNVFVIGFQRPGDRMRVISAGMEVKLEKFQAKINEELTGSEATAARLNRLGERRILVK